MDIQEELQLFRRYTNVFTGDTKAVLGISSVHLAQQLERYISPSLDLGWVIRCILDINSENLFSNCRSTEVHATSILDPIVQPEYKFAQFIIELCELFLCLSMEEELAVTEAERYILSEQSEFYFGEQLSELNKNLLRLACPELAVVQ